MRGSRGTMILDLLVGLGLLSLLALAAGQVVWRSFHVVRVQARSADVVSQEREVLALLSRDISAAQTVMCSSGRLALVLPDGGKVTYRDDASGLVRSVAGQEIDRWPLVHAAFACGKSGLVEVRLEGGGQDETPPLVCETAVWARAGGGG